MKLLLVIGGVVAATGVFLLATASSETARLGMHYPLLVMLNAAAKLEDLRVPPGNRFEALKGDRKGQHSIRVNQRWRVCFRWTESGPTDVEIVDYH